MTIPANVSPIDAGRLGLWLLSQRSHKAKLRRVAFPQRDWPQTLVMRFVRLICQWHVYEYAGSKIILGAICGIGPDYARNLMKRSSRLPPKHARMLAAYLSNHASQCEALAAEMRDYASQTERSKIYDKSALRRRRDMR